jgi:hypothetical protein
MSKRHQASRRKSYGRRQHEVRERQDRHDPSEGSGFELAEWGSHAQADPFAFLDPGGPRLRYAIGE